MLNNYRNGQINTNNRIFIGHRWHGNVKVSWQICFYLRVNLSLKNADQFEKTQYWCKKIL